MIERYVALLDAARLAWGSPSSCGVWLTGQDEPTVARFTSAIRSLPQVLECHLMAGDCDFLLRVVVADLDAYRQFQVKHLNQIKGVQSTKTEIPLERIKQSMELPI